MEFNEDELALLNCGYQAFVGRIHLFNTLSDDKYAMMGLEGWMQTELLVAMHDRGYHVDVKNKVRKDCDLIIRNGGQEMTLELRTGCSENPWKWLRDGIKAHKKASIFMFLCRDGGTANSLKLWLNENRMEFIEDHRMLDDDWMVMVMKVKQV